MPHREALARTLRRSATGCRTYCTSLNGVQRQRQNGPTSLARTIDGAADRQGALTSPCAISHALRRRSGADCPCFFIMGCTGTCITISMFPMRSVFKRSSPLMLTSAYEKRFGRLNGIRGWLSPVRLRAAMRGTDIRFTASSGRKSERPLPGDCMQKRTLAVRSQAPPQPTIALSRRVADS
jgi:hypothetical protein